jgi:hypothetical protein
MNWDELYKGYLSRCKGKPLNFLEFVKLRKTIIYNKKMEEKRREWFELR